MALNSESKSLKRKKRSLGKMFKKTREAGFIFNKNELLQICLSQLQISEAGWIIECIWCLWRGIGQFCWYLHSKGAATRSPLAFRSGKCCLILCPLLQAHVHAPGRAPACAGQQQERDLLLRQVAGLEKQFFSDLPFRGGRWILVECVCIILLQIHRWCSAAELSP